MARCRVCKGKGYVYTRYGRRRCQACPHINYSSYRIPEHLMDNPFKKDEELSEIVRKMREERSPRDRGG